MDSQMDMVRDISRQSNQYFVLVLIMNDIYRHYWETKWVLQENIVVKKSNMDMMISKSNVWHKQMFIGFFPKPEYSPRY